MTGKPTGVLRQQPKMSKIRLVSGILYSGYFLAKRFGSLPSSISFKEIDACYHLVSLGIGCIYFTNSRFKQVLLDTFFRTFGHYSEWYQVLASTLSEIFHKFPYHPSLLAHNQLTPSLLHAVFLRQLKANYIGIMHYLIAFSKALVKLLVFAYADYAFQDLSFIKLSIRNPSSSGLMA
ncbi:MAG: hypothetical protein U5L96_03455 [Owenweeksia sp.]|nr:hypothetical protein [Owenweeksia sp.]